MAKLPNRLVIEITNTDKVDELGYPVIDFESKDYAECIIEELEDLFDKMRRRHRQKGHDDYWYFSSGINLTILDKRICELKGEEWKPYIDRKIEAELKGETE